MIRARSLTTEHEEEDQRVGALDRHAELATMI